MALAISAWEAPEAVLEFAEAGMGRLAWTLGRWERRRHGGPVVRLWLP
jgi:hypothetical protein